MKVEFCGITSHLDHPASLKLSKASLLRHEICTPLTAILGAGLLLKKQLIGHPDQQKQAEVIILAGQRLLEITEQLLSRDCFQEEKTPTHKILLVEDDKLIQTVHGEILRNMGYCVDVADTGEEALLLFKKNCYRLILLDIGLPDISGIEVAKMIRQLELGRNRTSIIAATAYSEIDIKDKVLASGIDGIMSKPIPCEVFKKIFDSLM